MSSRSRSWRGRAALGVLLGTTLGASSVAAGGPESSGSPHEAELRAHGVDVLAPRIVPLRDELERARDQSLAHVVYGYYPHWAQDLTTIRWEALTHLAWFAVEMNALGEIDALHGWPDAATVDTAHAAGVRVDLTFALFSGAGIKALCEDPARRAVAIANMIDLMEQGGADGVSVDFEGFIDGTREPFVAFVQELRAGLDARGHADKEISLAGPAIDWGDEWDLDALLDSADWFFIMGYGYYWTGSSHAGPTGLLRVTDDWADSGSWSALRTSAHYADIVGADKRRQIIYGVPYYGREWLTPTSEMGAVSIENLGAITYSMAQGDLASGMTRLWDDGSKSAWYVWQVGSEWHQVYYDDAESLEHKYQLALDQDLGGVGIWALNYDAGHDELWDVLLTKMAPPTPTPEGHRDNPIIAAELPFSDARDTTEGASQYFNFYSCAPETPEYGKEWVYAVDVCAPGTLSVDVTSEGGADIDVHVLSDATEAACVARDDTSVVLEIEPGRHYIVADTYVSGSVEQEGAFTLEMDFAPSGPGCADHLACDAGACACPVEGQTDCDNACVDLQSDPLHCGACGAACGEGATCASGACGGGDETSTAVDTGGDEPPAAGSPAPAADPSDGCACRTGKTPQSTSPSSLLALVGVALALGGRQRRRPSKHAVLRRRGRGSGHA